MKNQQALDPPVSLRAGEQVLLSGGTWPLFTLMLIAMLAMFFLIFPLVIALFLILRTGRYWLTTERLIWKPRGRKLREVALEEITPARLKVLVKTRTLVVHAPSGRFSMWGVSNLPRLWGGLILFSGLPVRRLAGTKPTPGAEASAAAPLVVPAAYSEKWSVRYGFAVPIPGQVLYFPSSPATKASQVGLDAGLLLVGLATVRLKAELPWDVWIPIVVEKLTQDRIGMLQEVASKMGGSSWAAGSAKFEWQGRAGGTRVKLKREKEKLSLSFPLPSDAERFSADWQRAA
jgi:hypothetical protein